MALLCPCAIPPCTLTVTLGLYMSFLHMASHKRRAVESNLRSLGWKDFLQIPNRGDDHCCHKFPGSMSDVRMHEAGLNLPKSLCWKVLPKQPNAGREALQEPARLEGTISPLSSFSSYTEIMSLSCRMWLTNRLEVKKLSSNWGPVLARPTSQLPPHRPLVASQIQWMARPLWNCPTAPASPKRLCQASAVLR